MALPHDEWLHLAKRMAVGQRSRFHHRRERRPNLVVGNDADRYWCYCNSCKEGGVVLKEHVVITGKQAPPQSSDLTLPSDLERVIDSEPAVQHGVLAFLAHKNMDAQYLPEIYFSKTRCRILLCHNGEWLGRDTTERSPQKWITYNGSNHLTGEGHCAHAVVVEDTFSFYKVGWALQDYPYTVYSSLGTKLSDELMVRLLRHEHVHLMYDGDKAGIEGAARESHRLRSCGIGAMSCCAPAGMDPKDMAVLAIRNHFGR